MLQTREPAIWIFLDARQLHQGKTPQPNHRKGLSPQKPPLALSVSQPVNNVCYWWTHRSRKKQGVTKHREFPLPLLPINKTPIVLSWMAYSGKSFDWWEGSDIICLLQVEASSQWTVLIIPENNKWSQSKEEPGGILLIKPLEASTPCFFIGWVN